MFTFFAQANVLGASGSWVALLFLAGFALALGILLVGFAVAVVVDAVVAKLDGVGFVQCLTYDLTLHARQLDALFAGAYLACHFAGLAALLEQFVNGAIAVIVAEVAKLLLGLFLGPTFVSAVDAGLLSCGTFSGLLRLAVFDRETVVDLAVAVVVFAVARLLPGLGIALASAPFSAFAGFVVVALLYAATADALARKLAIAAVACSHFTHHAAVFEVFVGLTVAVVVDAVAYLFLGNALLFAGAPL